MTNTAPTTGAADLPEALIGAIMAAAYDFRDAHISGSKNLKRTAHAELESTVRNTLHALAAGQATTAQAVVPAGWNLVPTEPTQAMLDAVVTSMDDFLLGKEAEKQYREDWAAMLAAAPAQPAAQQGVAYAVLPEPYCNAHDDAGACYPDMFSEHQMRAFADATCALRASHGQAPAETGNSVSARADSVHEDAALWHWLAEYLVGTRTDLDDEIVASETVNDLRKIVEAASKQGGTHDNH